MNPLSAIFGNKIQVSNLSSDEFEKIMQENDNAVLLDVRTPGENKELRIPNSTLFDLMDPNFLEKIESLDKNKTYLVYCRSGNRSFYAVKEMLKLGFENVHNLEPGIIGWNGEIERG